MGPRRNTGEFEIDPAAIAVMENEQKHIKSDFEEFKGMFSEFKRDTKKDFDEFRTETRKDLKTITSTISKLDVKHASTKERIAVYTGLVMIIIGAILKMHWS